MFLRGTLKVNKRCVNFISELETYSYDEEKEDRNDLEKPIDSNNHAISGVRYLVSSLFPLIIKRERIEALRQYGRPAEPKKNPAR